MDFAIVPGMSDYELRLRRLVSSRDPKTTLVDKPSVADFLQELASQHLKGGDLVLGAHASKSAFVMPFDVPFDPAKPVRTDYEEVQDLVTKGSVKIPSSVRSDDTSVHLKGCRIGDTAKPVLDLMKQAFDNPKLVTAPKYLHAISDDAGQGVTEYMAYAYEVTTPDASNFAKRAELLAEFQLKPDRFKQGVEAGQPPVNVPSDKFDDWLPPQSQLDSLNEDLKLKKFTVRFDPPIIRKDPGTGKRVTERTLFDSFVFSAFVDDFTWPMDMTGKVVPSDDPARMALLKPDMQRDDRMKFPKVHPYPYYVRYGFDNFEDFYKGFAWSVTLVSENAKQTLMYVGRIYIYRLQIPVVKTGTRDLIFNYYPTSGTPTINFREDNAKYELFGVS